MATALSTSGNDVDETSASGALDLDVEDALILEDFESLACPILPCFGLVLGAMVFALLLPRCRLVPGVSLAGKDSCQLSSDSK